jgi:hypoxanthine phosphoribosyltransferase
MRGDIDRILIPQERIAERVRELARQITMDHIAPEGWVAHAGGSSVQGATTTAKTGARPTASGLSPEITIVPVLTGAMIFCADLIRHIPIAMHIGLLAVSSYPGRTVRSQGSAVLGEQLGDLSGRHVLLVDDIMDSGGTIQLVTGLVREAGAASVRTCVLLRKDRPSAKQVQVDYVGFEIPDEFVVGYGLDFNNYYRNLPDIVTLKAAVYARPAGGKGA